jgi:hypothetical protein
MAMQNQSRELSRDFYSNPDNYSQFSLTKDARKIIGCIDPRDPIDESIGDHKVMIQTAGAGTGLALDASLALTVARNELVTVEEGLQEDSQSRLTTVLDAHPDCKFVGSMAVVLAEISSPGDMTAESVWYWSSMLDAEDTIRPHVAQITAAAEQQREHVLGQEHMLHLVSDVDAKFPQHANVKAMRGENTARVYTVNLHPNIGIDRNKKDPDNALLIQGYLDDLSASIVDLYNARGIDPTVRGLRLTALLFRAAAVRTVLTKDMDDMAFFEVSPAEEGVRIQETQL